MESAAWSPQDLMDRTNICHRHREDHSVHETKRRLRLRHVSVRQGERVRVQRPNDAPRAQPGPERVLAVAKVTAFGSRH